MSVDFADSFKTIERAADRLEYFTRRHLADGRKTFVRLQLFNACIVMRSAGEFAPEEIVWDYTNAMRAVVEHALWNPETEAEPAGWIRHPSTARRRLPIICGCCELPHGFLEYRRP